MANVLVVDDMEIFRDPIAAALTKHGHTTRVASNGREALDEINRELPDVVLLDIAMPAMDGLATLKALRGQAETESLPVIMLTDTSEKFRILEVARLGISSYVLKSSFSLKEFLLRIDEAVEAKDKSKESQSKEDEGQSATPRSDFSLDGVEKLDDLGPLLEQGEVQEAIDAYGELQDLPSTISEALTLLESDDCSVEQVADVLRGDEDLPPRLLVFANSGVFTQDDPVETIDEAVNRIGLAGMRQSLLNLGVMTRFSEPDGLDARINPLQFWEHAIATGLIASEITRALAGEPDADDSAAADAFTMGLLHDVGRLVLGQQFPSEYSQVLDAATHLGLPLAQIESQMMGVNHAEAMAGVLKGWAFPEHLIAPIVSHHLPISQRKGLSGVSADAAAILSLANRLAHALLLGHSGDNVVASLCDEIEALGLDPEVIARVEDTIEPQVAALKQGLLGRSAEDAWPEYAGELKSQLPSDVRLLFVDLLPETNTIRMMCSRLFGPIGDQTPTVAVVHIAAEDDVERIGDLLREAEEAHGVDALPMIKVSPDAGLNLPDAVLAARPCEHLHSQFAVDRFVASVNTLVTPEAKAA